VKPSRVLLNVALDWNEILIDVIAELLIRKRFGLQPNTSVSSGRSAEAQKYRLTIRFSFIENSVDVFLPLNGHLATSSKGDNSIPSIPIPVWNVSLAWSAGRWSRVVSQHCTSSVPARWLCGCHHGDQGGNIRYGPR
jgi:hypothetical protein